MRALSCVSEGKSWIREARFYLRVSIFRAWMKIAVGIIDKHPPAADSADLVHGLHPGSKDHTSQDSRWTFASKELNPGVCVHVFAIKDVFDDVELSRNSR